MSALWGQLTPGLEQINVQLNQAKDSLNRPDFERLKRNDPFDRQIRQLRRTTEAQSGAQKVTRAWLKFYEILELTPAGQYLLGLQDPIRAFFNAELPGAFVLAANHYFSTHNKTLQWVVSSYLPKGADDHLEDQYGLIEQNPDRSLVGVISTNKGNFYSDGDLTNPKVPSVLAHLARLRLGDSPVLYTADGGFDVTGRENEQETVSTRLIAGEIETGFLSLKNGGVMVLKIFTFFTGEMLAYVLTLMRAFEQTNIFKPSTSGPTNSESYFIGIDYKGGARLPVGPEEITATLISATDEELLFIWNRASPLFTRQIEAIRQFISGTLQPVINLKAESVPKLPSERRIALNS